jgi:hypothetical protein
MQHTRFVNIYILFFHFGPAHSRHGNFYWCPDGEFFLLLFTHFCFGEDPFLSFDRFNLPLYIRAMLSPYGPRGNCSSGLASPNWPNRKQKAQIGLESDQEASWASLRSERRQRAASAGILPNHSLNTAKTQPKPGRSKKRKSHHHHELLLSTRCGGPSASPMTYITLAAEHTDPVPLQRAQWPTRSPSRASSPPSAWSPSSARSPRSPARRKVLAAMTTPCPPA